MLSSKCARVSLSFLTALLTTVLAACSHSDAIVTRRDGGMAKYPFTPAGFVTAVWWGDQAAVKMFLKRGMDVNATDSYGNTGLHAASDKKDSSMVRFLIEAGADPNLQNNAGYTALMLAAANNDLDILAVLLDAGADPSLMNSVGKTAADIAKDLGHTEALVLFVGSSPSPFSRQDAVSTDF